MTLYALVGPVTKDLLTLGGRPLVHDNREELEWLLPSAHIVKVSPRDLAARSPLMPLRLPDHPGLCHLTWPLKREDFR